jgi:hypothetical protein
MLAAHAVPGPKRQPLGRGPFADGGLDHLVGHLDGQIGAMLFASEVQHQVGRSRPARGCIDAFPRDEDVGDKANVGNSSTRRSC